MTFIAVICLKKCDCLCMWYLQQTPQTGFVVAGIWLCAAENQQGFLDHEKSFRHLVLLDPIQQFRLCN